MKKILVVIVLLTAILLPKEVLAWGTTGHRVIAQIAEKNIKSSTKKKIDKLLDNYPMAYWANWADFIKSDTTGQWKHTHIWHFVNAPGGLDRQGYIDFIKNTPQQNVYSEIPKLEAIIRNKNSSDDEKRIALYFLVHLVGDAHQPMHMGREEDLGGNKISVTWFRNPTNIHTVWDSRIVDNENYSYTEYANILNSISKEKKQTLQAGTLEDWMYDTYILANDVYANISNGAELSYGYSYRYKYVMEEQLQKGGLRLAVILDRIFK
jgi:hypothetical protein